VLRHEEILRKLSIRDDEYVLRLLANERANLEQSALDTKTHTLVRLAAVIAVDAATPLFLWTIDAALRHGASFDEIVGTLIAVTPAVGSNAVVAAAPKVAVALGYDIDFSLELVDGGDRA